MQPFTIALCQVQARDLPDAELALQDILQALDEAGAAGAQLVALPECSYPAYLLGDSDPYTKPGVRPFEEVVALLADKCRSHGFWLAAGLPVPHANGTLTNSGLVIDPTGEVRGRYDKHFLWHFDTRWFEAGTTFPVFETDFCRFGILICADGRQAEVARALAVNGAEVILDLTAWVSWGRTVPELDTTQCQYLMPARAFENAVWVAAADKWGPEAGSIIYAGKSSVFDPSGETVACGPTDANAVVTHRLEPRPADLVPRRPELYGRLTDPTDTLPVTAALAEPMVPAEQNARVAVVPGPDLWNPAEVAARYEVLRNQDVDLAVFPGMRGNDGWQVGLPRLEALVREHGGAIALAVEGTGCTSGQSAVLITPEATHEHRATHGRGIDLGDHPAPVVETAAGNVAVLCGDEMLVPEVARCLALEGADILAWSAFAPGPMHERIARTRCDENHLYAAAAWPGGGLLVSPTGAPITAVAEGTDVAMAWQVNRAMARWKDMAPGTNVIRDRNPAAYSDLTRKP